VAAGAVGAVMVLDAAIKNHPKFKLTHYRNRQPRAFFGAREYLPMCNFLLSATLNSLTRQFRLK
jgi:hypothetical protein